MALAASYAIEPASWRQRDALRPGQISEVKCCWSRCRETRSLAAFALGLQPVLNVVSVLTATLAVKLERAFGDICGEIHFPH